MIDARDPVCRASTSTSSSTKQLKWNERWHFCGGQGVKLGILETGFDKYHPDLAGADVTQRDFANPALVNSTLNQHGTYSVTTIIGQGRQFIKGIAPRIELLVATVVDADGIARPDSVGRGIDWLLARGAQLVAIPLGGSMEHDEITRALENGTRKGAVFFAAAGSGCFGEVLFPARHSIAIAVAASDDIGTLYYGDSDTSRLDLIAPGWNIPVSVTADRAEERTGSSIACVSAAAVAAVAISAGALNPALLSRSYVVEALLNRSA